MRHLATIGLGANLPSPAGSPEQTVEAAIRDLEMTGRVVSRSSLYCTEPVGYGKQPAFINAVAQLETDLDPQPLLGFLLAIERRFGRERSQGVPNGPRSLDLDLLLFDDVVLSLPGLSLPHPSIAERRFVLAPLCEIAPQLRHPVLGATAAEMLAALPDQKANRADAVRRLTNTPELS